VPLVVLDALPGGAEMVRQYGLGEGVSIFDLAIGKPIGDTFSAGELVATTWVSPTASSSSSTMAPA
jgi:hypothetical protein